MKTHPRNEKGWEEMFRKKAWDGWPAMEGCERDMAYIQKKVAIVSRAGRL
jgi:hypothetical protein